jgi:hypothetical protein
VLLVSVLGFHAATPRAGFSIAPPSFPFGFFKSRRRVSLFPTTAVARGFPVHGLPELLAPGSIYSGVAVGLRSPAAVAALHLRACLASFSISRSASQSAVRIPPEAAPPGRLSVCVSVLALVLTHRCAGPRQGSPPLPVGFWVVPPCATVLAPPWCSHSFRGAPPARCRSCECSGFALQLFSVEPPVLRLLTQH